MMYAQRTKHCHHIYFITCLAKTYTKPQLNKHSCIQQDKCIHMTSDWVTHLLSAELYWRLWQVKWSGQPSAALKWAVLQKNAVY